MAKLLEATLKMQEKINRDTMSEQTCSIPNIDIQAVVNAMGQAVILTDKIGQIVHISSQALQMTGWSESEALGRPVSDVICIIDAQTRQPAANLVQKTLENGPKFQSNHSLLKGRDNSCLQIAYRTAPIRDHNGNITAVMLVLSDQTQQINREKRHREAKEAAEKAKRVRDEFIANMSHELRTPLNGIMGMLQLLQTTDVDSEQIEYIDLGIKSGQRLGKLLTDILDLCMLEQGKFEIKMERFFVQDILDSIQEMFKCELENKGLNYNCVCAPDIPQELVGDRTRLTQVLLNLLGNAIKYTNAGKIVCEVQIKSQKEQNLELLFVISDTGNGIPDEFQEHIFEIFTQANDTGSPYTRKYEGAGLGIPLVKRLVNLMGGSVFLESQKGQGTRVYVQIPFEYPKFAEQQFPEVKEWC